MDVPLRLWDVKNNHASDKSVEVQKINIAIDKIRVEANRRYQELMQTDGYVTVAKLKDAYFGIGVKQETLLKLFEQHNSEFVKKVGYSRAQGTFQRYKTVYKHLCEFLPHTVFGTARNISGIPKLLAKTFPSKAGKYSPIVNYFTLNA